MNRPEQQNTKPTQQHVCSSVQDAAPVVLPAPTQEQVEYLELLVSNLRVIDVRVKIGGPTPEPRLR